MGGLSGVGGGVTESLHRVEGLGDGIGIEKNSWKGYGRGK